MDIAGIVLVTVGFSVLMTASSYAFVKYMELPLHQRKDRDKILGIPDILLFDGILFLFGFFKILFNSKVSLLFSVIGAVITIVGFILA